MNPSIRIVCVSLATLAGFALPAHADPSADDGGTVVPIIAVACEAFTDTASTFNCAAANAVEEGSVTVPESASSLDEDILIRDAYLSLSEQATEQCGGPQLCRGAYGVIGDQCIAIAQSSYYAGFGSFMGQETTLEDAEQTALNNCQNYVGQPGAACTIVIARCPTTSNP